ncbi:MAG: molybdate ABC transporter substrate-binding protein [Eggerthellaceae bacterium]|nr:molybdate ABC transporter substrate-binding protein [Eggerthellaceae bacterium]
MKKAMVAGAAACALAGVLALTGCAGGQPQGGSGAADGQPAVELQVFAANSLSKALDEAQELYTSQNPGITFADTQYKGSGELNEMLAAGSYADLLVTASKGTMDDAVAEGYVDEATRADMFTNELVFVSKEDSTLQDVTLDDLKGSAYSLCVGDDSVPAGTYAAQALSTVGLYEPPAADAGKTGAAITGKGGTYTGITPILQTSVGNVCKQAENGDVDLAIVYSSDVFRFGGVKNVGIIPDDTHKPIVYPGAVCAGSENAQAAADFMEWCLTDPDAQKIWQKWGFELSE